MATETVEEATKLFSINNKNDNKTALNTTSLL